MIERIKNICDYVSRGATPDYVDVGENKVMNQATFSKGSLDESNIRYTSKTNKGAQIKKGDLLMASTGGGVLGKVFYFDCDDENFYADSHVTILRSFTGKNLMKYLYYHFYLRYDEINATMVKGSTNQTELQRNYLLSYELDIPSLEEQNKMVAYLDTKLSEIDHHVSLLTSKRDAYLRLKKSIINRAVTKGLNPNVKMKDSGVDWIGEVPEGWEVKRIKELGKLRLGKMLTDKPISGYHQRPYLKSKNIDWLNLRLDSVEEMYFSDSELTSLRLNKNDLVISEGGEVGKTAIWKNEIQECYIQNSVHKLTFGHNCNPRYYLYLFYNLGHMGYFKSIVNLVSIMHLTYEKLRRIEVPVPELEEQNRISTYLDDKCSKIDLIISNLDKQISKYGELKRSLIDEVITGMRAV